MDDFLANLAMTLVGTLFGVVLGLVGDRWLGRRREAAELLRQEQALIGDLQRRRAFYVTSADPRKQPLTADEQLDADRCTASVLSARDRIAQVIDAAPTGSAA